MRRNSRLMPNVIAGALAVMLTLLMVLVACTSESATPSPAGTGKMFVRGGLGNCAPEGSVVVKDEAPGDVNEFTSTSGVITAVYIKAGTPCYEFLADQTIGCYTVTGIGTETVTVTRSGSGPDCKEISHIEYVIGAPTPTPTPEPTPTPTPTPEPTPTPTPTPEPTPTPTPTPEPTPSPTPTPTSL